ncbi:MAG: hypothetical protein J6Y32_06885 [Bacteroidales bacterium]|nr:hypothetical protein [Bacteroidales bacterium]
MTGLSLPLQMQKGYLRRSEHTRDAVDDFIRLLISTPKYSCTPDPEFGFVLNNLRFEILSENEGVVYKGDGADTVISEIYGKKISGSSSSPGTFAYDLKEAIDQYEKRLYDVRVTMTYLREERNIYINIKGLLVEDDSPYQLTTKFRIWN